MRCGDSGGGDKYAVLRDYFGFTDFRPGQDGVIDAIMAGRDVLAVMPTGAGKSLCYQIPALMLPGLTVVVSPLISLMKDQVQALQDAGVAAVFLNSSLSQAEYADALRRVRQQEIKLLYLAPERLTNPQIERLCAEQDIPLVVVDEAHCLSQWGHDFRPGYLDIAPFIRRLARRPVTTAFTATATPQVRDDIITLLKMPRSDGARGTLTVTTGFDRPNLYFEVQRPKDKDAALLRCLKERAGRSGIIYCATRKLVEELCALLVESGFDAAPYHAGLEDAERRASQDDFLYDRKPIIVATNAFGMGIDKSNVSFVIHYNMPKNIESYYQEAGRAGRDGAPADCILLYSAYDVRLNEFLINKGDEESGADPALREHKKELLKLMTFYSTSSECLRRKLLAYFGEDAPAYCGNCSNCLTKYDEVDVSLEARKIISCVYRLKQRGRGFGKTMIIDILKGSGAAKIKNLGLQSLSTWGIMKDDSAARIRAVLDFLVERRYLAQRGAEFPVIEWGERAAAFITAKTPLPMMLPREEAPAPRKAAGAAWGGSSGGGGASGAGAFDAAGAFDEALFEKLRGLRKRLAAAESLPAYIIFSDATLNDMCRKKPLTRAAFSRVTGVGQVKNDKYGASFTALIREHLGVQGREE
ncbi:MAG: DNA helicase RecQ [Treponema sp.]|jgi:ATP-dependent DNA helicase RecQ|nr:DNA helicase RecQ [Treponema sp.]